MKKHRASNLIIAAVCALVLGELFARFVLGLGDPPLSIPDSNIDYLFAPNQKCVRFGNKVIYNNCSMRCEWDIDTSVSHDYVFVVGDSVVNGGVLTDQDCLSTSLLQKDFPNKTICNVSAGSWGPGNYRAYFDKYINLRGGGC